MALLSTACAGGDDSAPSAATDALIEELVDQFDRLHTETCQRCESTEPACVEGTSYYSNETLPCYKAVAARSEGSASELECRIDAYDAAIACFRMTDCSDMLGQARCLSAAAAQCETPVLDRAVDECGGTDE